MPTSNLIYLESLLMSLLRGKHRSLWWIMSYTLMYYYCDVTRHHINCQRTSVLTWHQMPPNVTGSLVSQFTKLTGI